MQTYTLLLLLGLILILILLILGMPLIWIRPVGRSPDSNGKPEDMRMSEFYEQSQTAVRSLGLPQVFVDIWDEKVPIALTGWRRPETFFEVREKLAAKFPRLRTCIPLWEEYGEQVFAYDTAAGEFVVCYYFDEPTCDTIATSYQGLAAHYLTERAYAGSKRLPEISTILEFKYLDRLLKWVAVEDADDPDDADESQRKFVQSIPPGR